MKRGQEISGGEKGRRSFWETLTSVVVEPINVDETLWVLLLESRDVGENRRWEIDTFVASRSRFLSKLFRFTLLLLFLFFFSFSFFFVHVVDVFFDVCVICFQQ